MTLAPFYDSLDPLLRGSIESSAEGISDGAGRAPGGSGRIVSASVSAMNIGQVTNQSMEM
jgi:hypothetical protein